MLGSLCVFFLTDLERIDYLFMSQLIIAELTQCFLLWFRHRVFLSLSD